MPSADFQQLMKTLQNEVNDYLEQSIFLKETSSRLIQAMRYSLLAPGKRIRPILVLLSCEACGGRRILAMDAAAAVEMVHAYSLIHDDLPAMDNDDLRRGRPTCHKAFDEATALLAGNALLTLAFKLLATGLFPAQIAVECVNALAGAAGDRGMIGGQMDDILQEGKSNCTLEQLKSLHARKTGALIEASCRIGARIGQDEIDDFDAQTTLTRYAAELGLAFQISDDLLDVQSDAATLGKNTQKDAAKGKLTYPGLLGIEGAKKELQLAHERGLEALKPMGASAQRLGELLTYVVERDR
ncbi:MAG TPA: polyprenyl synthetase family protein [Gemmatales bacterium]|nr:polyprenyl synthetase family protein [Gemmatales bacterium]